MNFDPQKFFISQLDFVSILLPGVLLTWLPMAEMGPLMRVDCYTNHDNADAYSSRRPVKWSLSVERSHRIGRRALLSLGREKGAPNA